MQLEQIFCKVPTSQAWRHSQYVPHAFHLCIPVCGILQVRVQHIWNKFLHPLYCNISHWSECNRHEQMSSEAFIIYLCIRYIGVSQCKCRTHLEQIFVSYPPALRYHASRHSQYEQTPPLLYWMVRVQAPYALRTFFCHPDSLEAFIVRTHVELPPHYAFHRCYIVHRSECKC